MRFAPHISFGGLDRPLFVATVGSIDPIDQIRFAAERGFAGIQDPFVALRPASQQSRIGEALARHGLEAGSFIYTAPSQLTSAWGSFDVGARPVLMRNIDAAIEIAERTTARHIVVIAMVDPHQPRTLQFTAMAENLKYAAERAERAGKIICIESISALRLPTLLLHHLLDAYAIVKAVNSPALRLVFDFAHVQAMDGDVLHNLARTWDAVGVVQIADHPDRVEPGAGELNFVSLLADIARRGYRGLLELEHVWARPGIAAETAGLAALTRLQAEVSKRLADPPPNGLCRK